MMTQPGTSLHPTPSVAMGLPTALGTVRVDAPALARALKEESKLLARLREVLVRQRQSVANDDLPGVDQSVFDAQRILLSLTQARRRRRSLIVLASGDENLRLAQLPEVLGRQMTPELGSALREVLDTAAEVATEMDLNRHILNGALMAGNEMPQALGGAPKTAAAYDGTGHGRAAQGRSNILLNRQV